jgi:hypothetical protein
VIVADVGVVVMVTVTWCHVRFINVSPRLFSQLPPIGMTELAGVQPLMEQCSSDKGVIIIIITVGSWLLIIVDIESK